MPTIRYQIRSEYGLAEPELYQGADKDDPEAILEGVAMAGLVGVLRQLGDLAEFAAQIFHNLHEEVMTTAARGHGMMLRVQQLEAEFPSIERAFLSQSNHSNLSYNEGIDWHCNIQLDQNLLTHGDMPRFILDSYEECRGPPRLFTLDKFDVAGAGACLKRYTDPSFFKMEFASSDIMEIDVQREKKGRKIKKKGPRWKNGQTLESLMSPKADSELLPANSNKVHDKTAIRVVKLKSRHRNGNDTSKSKRLMELILEMHMDVQKPMVNDSGRDSQTKIESGNLGDSATDEVHDILVDTPDKYVAWENGITCVSPTKKEASSLPANGLEHPIIEDELLKDPGVEPFSEVDESKKIPQQVSKNKLSAELDDTSYANLDLYALSNSQKTASVEKFKQVVETEVSIDGYRSDEFGSEQENFVDAVNTIDSEIETDVECMSKPDTVALSTEACSVGIDSDGLDDMKDHFSAFDQPQTHTLKEGSVEISPTPSEPNKLGGISSLSDMDASDSTVEVELTKEEVTTNLDSNSDKVIVENNDSKFELPGINAETTEPICSNGSVTCNDTPEDLTFGSKIENETQNSSVTDSPSHTISNLLGLDNSHAIADVQVTVKELAANSDIDSVKSIGGSHDQVPEVLGPSSEIAKTICPITDNDCLSTIDGPILGPEVVNSSEPFSATDSASSGVNTYPRENLEEPLFFTNQSTESLSYSEGESGQIEYDKTESADHLYEQHPQDSVQSNGLDDENYAQLQQQDLELDIPSNGANGTVEVAEHLDYFQQNPCLDDHLTEQIAEAVPGRLHHEDLVDDTSSDEAKESVDVAAYMDAPSTVTKDIDLSESSSPEDYMLEMSPQEVDNGTDFMDHFYEMKDDDSRNDDVFGYWEYAPPPFTVQDSQSEIQTENDIDAYSHGVMISGLPENELDNNFELAHLDDLEMLDKHAFLEHSPDSKFSFDVNSEDSGSPSLQKELEDLTEAERDKEHHKENSTELVMPLQPEIDAENKTLSNGTNPFLVANTSEDLDYSMPTVDDKKLCVIEDDPDKKDMTVELELHHDEFSSDSGTVGATGEIPLQLEDGNISIAETSYQPETPEMGKAEEALLITYNHSSLATSDSGLPMKDLSQTGDSSRLHNQNDETISYRSDQNQYVDNISENSLGRKEFSPKSLGQGSEAEEEQENMVPYNFSDPSLLIKEQNSASLQEDPPAVVDSSLPSVPIHKEVSNMQENIESSTLSLHQDIRHGEADSDITANLSGELSRAKLVDEYNNLGSSELNGTDMLIPNSDIAGQLELLHTSDMSLSNFVSFSTSLDLRGIGPEDTASCPFPPLVEVPPPLPPLPPLQWRTGKFPLRSLISDANLFHLETNPSGTSNIEEKPPNGLLVEGSKGTQLEHQFAAPLSLQLSELLPTADAGRMEEDTIVLHAKNVPHSNSHLVSSSSPLDESLHVPDTSKRLGLQSPHPLASFSVSEDIITEHSPLVETEEVRPLADKILQCDQILSTSNKESYQEHENDEVNMETGKAPQTIDILVGSVADRTQHLHGSELSGGETLDLGKPLDFPPAPLLEVPQLWYPHLLEQSEFSQFSILRKEDDERLTGKPLKIRNRPKDPLIEAVAAHDRSSLRKVPNLIQASDKPEADQRNTLLEQIRSKAFNLKPAAAAKQNIKGPSTNLKVAAIIEKANAIRQAFVGSDEDDDEDSWNSA